MHRDGLPSICLHVIDAGAELCLSTCYHDSLSENCRCLVEVRLLVISIRDDGIVRCCTGSRLYSAVDVMYLVPNILTAKTHTISELTTIYQST